MIGDFEFTVHTPTDREKEVMKFVEERRTQMNTSYRKELVDLADWAKKEYDSLPQDRISNLDIFKTGLARAVVNHRLVMLYDSPSEAIYRAEEDSDKHRVEILKQVDKYDKKVSRFEAMHQEIFRTANIEGTAIGMVSWHEEKEGEITRGTFSTLTELIPIKDFYWDPAGIFINGNSAYTCNDAAYGRVISMNQFRNEYASSKFKNVDSVRPNVDQPGEEVWRDDWEEGRDNTDGDDVYVFTIKIKRFYEGGKFVDKEFIVANGQLIYDGSMLEPIINGEKWLPFFKIEGIPTGGFGGLGIPALIRHPQEALDRMLTMAEAQAELAVNPVLFYQTTGELLPDTIDYFPGAAYPYKGTGNGITNDMQFFQQPDITAGAQYIINKMMEMITVVTGIDVQALLAPTGELAIQTQNKKDIQEKTLKMTVLYNETHGWTDMATIRLAYLQKMYPSIRIQRILAPNGQETTKIDYPRIKVEGFSVKESFVQGKNVSTLVKSPGAYSGMTIRPEDLRFNVDVMIESSQMASGVDTVKQNKWDKTIDSLARIPGIEQVIDPVIMAKNTVKFGGFKSSDMLIDQVDEGSDSSHPARKEFKAILVSDTIPFEPILPERYKPEEYLFVFRDLMKLPEYKKAPQKIKALIQERLTFHITNFSDPYFEEKQKLGQEAAQTQQVQADREQGNTLKALGGSNEPPTSLSSQVKSEAAKIGDVTKKAKQGL